MVPRDWRLHAGLPWARFGCLRAQPDSGLDSLMARRSTGCIIRKPAPMVAAVFVAIMMLVVLWAGPTASAGVFLPQSSVSASSSASASASASPSPAPVKFYIVPPAGTGRAQSLYAIAEMTLGDGNRFMEIFNLNKGRPQPRGGRLENPHEIFPGWVLQLPGDASGPAVHFGPLPVVSARPTSLASPRPAVPSRPVAAGASAPHSPIGWAAVGIVIVAALALAGLTVGISRRRRTAGAVRRGPSHAKTPGPRASGGVAAAATTAPDIRVADPPWPAADLPSWPAADLARLPAGDHPNWPAGGGDHPSWPAGDLRYPDLPRSPAGDHTDWPAGGGDHPSWPAGDLRYPAADLPRSPAGDHPGRPAELHHDHRSQAASLSAVPLVRDPAGNWGPATGSVGHDGEMLQLLAHEKAGLSAPAAPAAREHPTADPVRLAGRILSVADDEAAAITQRASSQAAATRAAAEREAAEITRQASSHAADIRAAAEAEAAQQRAAFLAMSAEFSRVATLVTENLVSPTKPAAEPLARPADRPAAKPSERPATKPSDRAATKPVARPADRLAAKPSDRPATEPVARPAAKPAGPPRQYAAMRLTRLVVAALFLFAVTAGTTEIALHGFSFFVFRAAGTGATPNSGLKEDQGPGQPDAPGTNRRLTGHKP